MGSPQTRAQSHVPCIGRLILSTAPPGKFHTKFWKGCQTTGNLIDFWWHFKMVQPLWKTFGQYLLKLSMYLPYDLVSPCLERKENTYPHQNLYPNVLWGYICNFQRLERTQMPSKIKQINFISHTMEYYLAIRKNWFLIYTVTWMNFTNTTCERSQTQNYKCCMIPVIKNFNL